uniref:C-type lectin mannose-binding isoform-like isoform X2 n=1 Tax=Styela clava TaxID=7725 RepID=UPI00193A9E5A|nr:C-type lectin mannose-binding isoform-like isoform X2 [Styela clava]
MNFLSNLILIFFLILKPSLIFADDPFSNVQLVIEDGQGSCKKEDHLSIKSEQELREALEKKLLKFLADNPGQEIAITTQLIANEVSCPPQWFKASNNYCYEYHTQEANYVNAKSTCEKKGGTLAAAGIRDSSVRRELFKRINIGKYIWIGLDDIKKEKRLIWADGGSYVKSEDINWDYGQPDDDDHNEDCVHLSAKHGDWKLNDINCDSKLTYLVKKKTMIS